MTLPNYEPTNFDGLSEPIEMHAEPAETIKDAVDKAIALAKRTRRIVALTHNKITVRVDGLSNPAHVLANWQWRSKCSAAKTVDRHAKTAHDGAGAGGMLPDYDLRNCENTLAVALDSIPDPSKQKRHISRIWTAINIVITALRKALRQLDVLSKHYGFGLNDRNRLEAARQEMDGRLQRAEHALLYYFGELDVVPQRDVLQRIADVQDQLNESKTIVGDALNRLREVDVLSAELKHVQEVAKNVNTNFAGDLSRVETTVRRLEGSVTARVDALRSDTKLLTAKIEALWKELGRRQGQAADAERERQVEIGKIVEAKVKEMLPGLHKSKDSPEWVPWRSVTEYMDQLREGDRSNIKVHAGNTGDDPLVHMVLQLGHADRMPMTTSYRWPQAQHVM